MGKKIDNKMSDDRSEKQDKRKKTQELLGNIFKSIWSGGLVLAAAVTAVLSAFGYSSIREFSENYCQKPDLRYEEKDGEERFLNRFQLKAGKIKLHSQMEIRFDDAVVKILYLEDYYDEIDADYDQEKQGFVIASGRRKEAENLGGIIKDKIIEKLDGRLYRDQIEIKLVKLLEVEYQNMDRKDKRLDFYYEEDGMIQLVAEEDVQRRIKETDVYLNVETDQLEEIVQDCTQIIRDYNY